MLGLTFGPDYAHRFHRKPAGHNDIWHLDEVVIAISGRKHWLWRAVDKDGYVLDEIVQTRRNPKAVRRRLARLLQKQGRQGVEHRSHKGLNNQAESSHVLLPKRERIMQHFRSAGVLQRFVSMFSALRKLFLPHRTRHSSAQAPSLRSVENHHRRCPITGSVIDLLRTFTSSLSQTQ
jgi:putative transposase